MTRKTFSNIKAGDVLEVGYRKHLDTCKFLGFTNNDTKYSEKPVFSTVKELLAYIKVSTFADLERVQDAADKAYGYGHHFYAVFEDQGNGDVFCAYIYKGRWVLGSSADVCKLQ